METKTDAELIDASRRGDRQAFGELVERCARMVGAVSYARTCDRALGEDVTQDTFVVAWCELRRLRDASALRPWLCGIARNLAHKARRKRAREVALADGEVSLAAVSRTPFEAVEHVESERVVAAALARVPEVYREVLVMFHYEEQSTRDVAAALGVRVDVVHKRLSRGRQFLAANVGDPVEPTLRRLRTRRDLVVSVISALPVALAVAPSRAEAAHGASNTWRLAVAAMVASLASIGAVAAWPQAEVEAAPIEVHSATSPASPKIAAVSPPTGAASRTIAASRRAATPPRAPARPTWPALPDVAPIAEAPDITCAGAAHHILAASLARFEAAGADRATQIQHVTSSLEGRCRDEKWSHDEIECIVMSEDASVEACRLDEPSTAASSAPAIAAVPAVPVPDQVDVSCKAVGAHVGELMISSMAGTQDDNVAASVLVDTQGLPSRVIAACEDERWAESWRRCFAAATRFAQIVACKRADGGR